MGVLREVSNRIQVIIATHSPLVINELQPNEVTILTRDEKPGDTSEAARSDDPLPAAPADLRARRAVAGAGSLPEWLALANVTFRRLIDGVTSK